MKRYCRTNVFAVFCALTSVFLILNGCGGGGGGDGPTPTPPPGPPAAPTAVTADAGNGQVILNWAPVAGATSYNVYYGTTAGITKTTGTKVGTNITTSTFTVTGLANGTPCFFLVTAVNSVGESGESAVKEATPSPTPTPAAPPNVRGAVGVGKATISWDASTGATSYNIYYGTSSGVTKTSGTKVTGAVSPRDVTGLTNGTTYFFVVTAVNANGESAESIEVSVTPSASPPPAAPTGVFASSSGAAGTTISWSAVSGATSYNIYWSTASGVTKTNGTKITGAVSPQVVTGLTVGTTYFFVVTAVNANGESAESSEAFPPAPPTGVTATAGNGQVTISWSAVSGATSYNIWWSTTPGVTRTNGIKITGVTSPYTHTGLTNGTTYYYIVKTVNSSGESMRSAEVSAMPTDVGATYSISGTVSGAVTSGVTITLTGAAIASTTTDASGNFSITGLANGAYTVTPVMTGYTFTPASSAVIVSGANITGIGFISITVTVLESVSQAITAAQGGTITLPGGSSVTIPAGALASDQTVHLSLVSSLPKLPPNGSLTSVGPALVLDFDSKQTALPEGGNWTFVIRYGANLPAGLTGSAPLVDVMGSDNFLGGVPISCDSSDNCFVVWPSTIQNAQGISGGPVNLSTEITLRPPPRFGPRIWNGSIWLDYPQGFDCNRKTLVLIHGILSTVENAFGFGIENCVNEIMSRGGYQQVIGFNYDFAGKRIDENGQLFADFLNSLQEQCGPTAQVDILAHSLGTLNALYAASRTNLKINNMILEGGPLDGTPAATTAARLLTLYADWENLPTVLANTIHDSIKSGWYLDLLPGNPLLQIIRTNAVKEHPNTNYIRVFGSKSFLLPIPNGFVFEGAPNDGVSPSGYTIGADLPGPPAGIFSETHTRLECNSDILQFVQQNLYNPPDNVVTEVYKGTKTTTETWTYPVNPICSPNPATRIITSTPATVEFDVYGTLLKSGTVAGTSIWGPSTFSFPEYTIICKVCVLVEMPGGGCLEYEDQPLTVPGDSMDIPGDTFSETMTTNGTTVIFNDPFIENNFMCISESYPEFKITVEAVTGIVHLDATQSFSCTYPDAYVSGTSTYSLTRQ